MIRNYNNLTVLTDKIKNLKLENFPTDSILNNNEQYTLIVKSDTCILRYYLAIPSAIVRLPLIKDFPYTVFTINWGDYNTTKIKNYEYKDNLYDDNYIISTQYNNPIPTLVTIKINGDFKGFNNSESSGSLSTNYFYYTANPDKLIEVEGKPTYNVDSYLYAIDSWGNIPFETLKNAFINASGLMLIPNAQMPNVNNCENTFKNCINLYNSFSQNLNSMSSFQLPLNTVNCINMFQNTKIESDFNNLNFPEYLTTISSMFAGTKITNLNKDFFTQFKYYAEFDETNCQYLSSYYYHCIPSTMQDVAEIKSSTLSSILIEF